IGADGGTVLDGLAGTTHLAATWDPTRDGRTAVRASLNQYVDVNGADLARFTAASQVSQTCGWDPSNATYTINCSDAGGASGRPAAVADAEAPAGARREDLGATVAAGRRDGALKINAAYTLSFLRGNVLDSSGNQPFGEIAARDPFLYGYLPDDSRHAIRVTA